MLTNNKPIKTPVTFVCLSCCTCKRPKMLSRTLSSIKKLIIPDNIRAEVVITDNDENESAKPVVKELQTELKIPVHYFVEKKRGISNARNKTLEEVIKLKASHMLFFDDDEMLDENCLIEHINLYQTNSQAFISSGPTVTVFLEKFPSFITKHMVFKQKTSKQTGYIRQDCACGNVFFPVSLIEDFNLRFDNEYVFMGGEDGDFFKKASKLGFTIIWNNEAVIYEMVSKSRGNLKWILKKCYYNGYAAGMSKFKYERSKLKRIIYILKQTFVLIINLILLLPSLFFGLTAFFNRLGTCIRAQGKILLAVFLFFINFYRNIYCE